MNIQGFLKNVGCSSPINSENTNKSLQQTLGMENTGYIETKKRPDGFNVRFDRYYIDERFLTLYDVQYDFKGEKVHEDVLIIPYHDLQWFSFDWNSENSNIGGKP